VATDRPVVSRETLQAVFAYLPGPWALALVAIVFLVALMAGFRHIMRRQKSRIEVPYGVAIAAAGLWVMGAQTLVTAHLAA
jgi:prepilin peptidase CpaA